MAPPISQIIGSTYDDVVNEKKGAADQWSDSSFLKALEKLGGVKRTAGGATLQLTLDYQANPAVDFLATDVTPTSTAKTDVLTAASYPFIPLVSPMNWTLFDEAINSEKNQKVDLVDAIVSNGLRSHDQAVEVGFFALTATDGFLSLPLLYPNDPTAAGTVGTIPSTELWWRSKAVDYGTATGATLMGFYTALYNSIKKGTSGRAPNVMVGSSVSNAVFEAALVPNQRFENVSTASGGFEAVQFKNIPFLYTSAYTGKNVWMFHTSDTQLFVVESAWRSRREAIEHVNAAMMNMKIFSVLQLATRNRSRGGVAWSIAP